MNNGRREEYRFFFKKILPESRFAKIIQQTSNDINNLRSKVLLDISFHKLHERIEDER